MKTHRDCIILLFLSCLTMLFVFKTHSINKKIDESLEITNKISDADNLRTVIYKDQELASIKQENKDLYDSIKVYKKQIDNLIRFKYEKKYKTDTIYVKEKQDTAKVNVYEYNNAKNDTLDYNLKIGSVAEPSWYTLDVKMKEEFTIVNKKLGEYNETNIKYGNNGEISDLITYKRKKKFSDNFHIGPSINAGYDIINKQFGINLGVSITYSIK